MQPPETVAYGDHPAQVCDVYRAGDGASVAVLIHGGFWRARYTLELMRPLALDLAARGWGVWNVEFRRLGPLSRGGWPATFDDVRAAIDALADHADTSRVIAVGHSAGGHLALLAAAHPGRVRLAGAVSQGGVADLAEADRLGLGAGVTRRFAHGDPAADPMSHLPIGVPTLLVHGADDDTVPAALSERYAAAARRAGDHVDLDVRPGEGHFEHLDPRSGAWARVVAWLDQRVRT